MATREQTRVVVRPGASEYTSPPSRLRALARARVHDVAESFVLLVLPREPKSDRVGKLTEAELSVATLAASGLSNRATARLRGSSERTVANHLASVYKKLGLSGRRELRAHLKAQRRVDAP